MTHGLGVDRQILWAFPEMILAVQCINLARVLMKTKDEDRQRYKITACHRNQTFVGQLRRDPDTYGWSWKGYINYDDGDSFSFASQRSFSTKEEAEDYLCRFARDRIDLRLNMASAGRR